MNNNLIVLTLKDTVNNISTFELFNYSMNAMTNTWLTNFTFNVTE